MAYVHVENLHVRIGTGSGPVRAVCGLTLKVDKGEIHGLAGESGSGKSMTCMTLLGLAPRAAEVAADNLEFDGLDLLRADWRSIRGARIAMIPQNPGAALNPAYRIRHQMDVVLGAHTKLRRRERAARAIQLLEDVRLPAPQRVMTLFPHQMSGGMQQRALIAMALAAGAKLLITDEATTALDVTAQAEILSLLSALRVRYGLTMIFITHDLALLSSFCDRVSVVQRGRIVESGSADALFRKPGHPCTQALLAAFPGQYRRGMRISTGSEIAGPGSAGGSHAA